MTSQTRGLLNTFIGTMCVVPDALFVRLIDADPLVIAFWRSLNAGAAITLGLWLAGGSRPFAALRRAGAPAALYMLASGGSGVLFVLAVSLTRAANVVFIIASMPAFAALWSRIFLGEPVSRRTLLTMGAVALGLGLIGLDAGRPGEVGAAAGNWRGDLLALALAAIFAGGLTAARRARPVSMVPAVGLAYLAAALALLPFIDPFAVPPDQWWLVFLNGGFIVASATGLALGPRYITSPEVALMILLESVLSPLLVWAALGEAPGTHTLAGGAVVISALAISNLVALRRLRNRRPPPAG